MNFGKGGLEFHGDDVVLAKCLEILKVEVERDWDRNDRRGNSRILYSVCSSLNRSITQAYSVCIRL
jgi:hypothetical protein